MNSNSIRNIFSDSSIFPFVFPHLRLFHTASQRKHIITNKCTSISLIWKKEEMKTSNTSNKTNKIRTAKENKTNNSKRVRLFDIAIVNGIDKCIAIE